MEIKGDKRDFTTLLEIMDILRGPGGCPWDLKQTVPSLKKYMLEEVYEALDAVDREDWDHLCEELGDVLLEVVFMAKICQQEGRFTIADSIEQINEKLIRRHPHIFENEESINADEVYQRWHQLKMKEKNSSMAGILKGIPGNLPALLRAYRLSERVSKVGFDWENVEQVLEKYDEEWEEFQEARREKDADHMEEEFGDLMFSLVNVGRFLNINAEDALRKATEKFTRRFGVVEKEYRENGQDMADTPIEQLEASWQKAKKKAP